MPTLDAYFEDRGPKEFLLPEIAETYSGRLIICGDAPCVWEDLENLGAANMKSRGSVYLKDAHFMCVNHIGVVFPGPIEHWYSNDMRCLPHWIGCRRPEYKQAFPFSGNTHSCNPGAKWQWPIGGPGTSGFNACLVGVGLGYDEIVLCGLPLDNSGHNGEPHWRRSNFRNEVPDTNANFMNKTWRMAKQTAFEGKVKSMSGRTKDWFGAP